MENLVAVLCVDQDAHLDDLAILRSNLSRLMQPWRSCAIFLNVISSRAEGQTIYHSDELTEEWLQVAQTLSHMKQPVIGIAIDNLSLPGILVLDACDFVVATTDHQGTHIDRVLSPEELTADVQRILEEVAGSSRQMLKRQKRHLVQQKILARLPTAQLRRGSCASGSSSVILPLSKAVPHSASTRASVRSENGPEAAGPLEVSLDETLLPLFLHGVPITL